MGVSESCLVVSDSLLPHGLYSPWNSPGQSTGVVAFPFSSGFSQPRDQTQVSCIAGRFFISWATREARVGEVHIKMDFINVYKRINIIEWWNKFISYDASVDRDLFEILSLWFGTICIVLVIIRRKENLC